MGEIIERVIRVHGVIESAEVIDYVKALGFKYSTLAGITFSMSDVKVPAAKKELYGDAVLNSIIYNLKKESLSEEEIKEKSFIELHKVILKGADAVKDLVRQNIIETTEETFRDLMMLRKYKN